MGNVKSLFVRLPESASSWFPNDEESSIFMPKLGGFQSVVALDATNKNVLFETHHIDILLEHWDDLKDQPWVCCDCHYKLRGTDTNESKKKEKWILYDVSSDDAKEMMLQAIINKQG
jgi:hypothetical protein